MLALVGLAGAGARAVDRLSGGEQQRVALARALAPAPRLLMLDEPLASVDRERRAALGGDLHRIVRAARTATLLVTHDLDEAFTLADSVVVLDAGRAVRAGPAEEVWHDPGSVAAARFLGVTTELALVGDGRAVATPWGPLASAVHGPVTLGLRPAHLRIEAGASVPGTVRNVWFRLDHYAVEIDTAFGPMTAVAPTRPPLGSSVTVAADLSAAMTFTA